jgi:alkylation response protein AidB-like acyl-CoA dehydrogenase
MDTYRAPIDAIRRAMRSVGLEDVLSMPAYAGVDAETIDAVLEGFGAVAADAISPTDQHGDEHPPTLDPASGRVQVPEIVAGAFAAYTSGGWNGLSAPAEFGGGGLPSVVSLAVHEMFGSANMALSLNPMLTQGATELIDRWGDERQRRVVVPRLVDGSWTGTMNLTEPDAGSDLGAVRTTATPTGDGRYLVNGTKIFITWGEHELTENIVHLVLARTPGGPEGTRGLSVYLVPKFAFADDGSLRERNRVWCRSLEHKLGIHGSPTCVMEFTDAVGELVGELNTGMGAMFTMMNLARLAVGVQGVSVGERSLQQALAYATERTQGRAVGARSSQAVAIVEHPDVRRSLADIQTTVDAGRLLTYATAIAIDVAAHAEDPEVRAAAQRRADLLTPLAKAWTTDQGVRMASAALQLHGGMGYVEETGIAQRYRDIRIAPIYEGTNAIQAIDLVSRKVVRDGGRALSELLEEIERSLESAGDVGLAAPPEFLSGLESAIRVVSDVTQWAIGSWEADPRAVLTGATAFLELVAVTTAGWLLLRQAVRERDPAARARCTARLRTFHAEHLDRCPSRSQIALGASSVDAALDLPGPLSR